MDSEKKKETQENTGVRLNKYLSMAGFCSRREADRLIEGGNVQIDGKTATAGEKVLEGQTVTVNGMFLSIDNREQILLAVYKPRGVVCTTDRKFDDVLLEDIVNYPKRVFSVGRLDKESEGLILMTNDGEVLNQIMRARNFHEKEYIVQIDKNVTEEFLKKMASGVKILDTVTRPCKIWQTGKKRFHIILTQGLNRQIRRMCEACGCKVTSLKRIRVMNIELGDLKPGTYRELGAEERSVLLKLLEGSDS